MAESGEVAIDLAASTERVAVRPLRASGSRSRAAVAARRADFGQRLGALLFDVLLFLIALMLATFLLSSVSQKSIVSSNAMLAAFYTLAIALFALNFVLMAGRTGQTIGKRLVGIRVVMENGEPIGYANVLVRHCVGYALSSLAAFLGFLWVIWDPKQQGWHDKIARTVVVLAR